MVNNKIFFVPKPINSPTIRVFFFPYAGGSTSTYIPWVKHFNEEVELVLVQLPGRGGRLNDLPHDNMNSLISELMEDASYITSLPYILFGHSFGSTVAFELSCQLKQSNFTLPLYLIASGCKAPHLPNKINGIHNLSHKEFMQHLEDINGTPNEVLANSELMDLLIPAIRADFKIAYSYRATQACLALPILVLFGVEDTEVKPEQIVAWEELSEMDVQFVCLPGDHFFINQYSPLVIKQIKTIINKFIR